MPAPGRKFTSHATGSPAPAAAIVEIAITVVPLAGLWALAWATLDKTSATGWLCRWPSPPPVFLVRLFAIQHDCGHGSFFRHRLANDWFGRIAGVLTFTPYGVWRRTPTPPHHASTGNLDRRGLGDVETLTVQEYRAAARSGDGCANRLYPPSRW